MCTTVEDILIESIKVHESYDATRKLNDIALLRLSLTVEFSKKRKNVRPICLPVTRFQQVDDPQIDKTLTVAGWGHTENNTESTNDVLLQALVPYISNDLCVSRFKEAELKHPLLKVSIYESQICAGGVDGVDS